MTVTPITPCVHVTLHLMARRLTDAERHLVFEAAANFNQLQVGRKITHIKFMCIAHEFVPQALWESPFFMTGDDGIDEKLIWISHKEYGRVATIRVPVYPVQ